MGSTAGSNQRTAIRVSPVTSSVTWLASLTVTSKPSGCSMREAALGIGVLDEPGGHVAARPAVVVGGRLGRGRGGRGSGGGRGSAISGSSSLVVGGRAAPTMRRGQHHDGHPGQQHAGGPGAVRGSGWAPERRHCRVLQARAPSGCRRRIGPVRASDRRRVASAPAGTAHPRSRRRSDDDARPDGPGPRSSTAGPPDPWPASPAAPAPSAPARTGGCGAWVATAAIVATVVLPRERAAALDGVIESGCQREHVGGRRGRMAFDLLGRHVGGRTHHEAGRGDAGCVGHRGDAEVDQLGAAPTPAAARQQHVRRLHVAMDRCRAGGRWPGRRPAGRRAPRPRPGAAVRGRAPPLRATGRARTPSPAAAAGRPRSRRGRSPPPGRPPGRRRWPPGRPGCGPSPRSSGVGVRGQLDVLDRHRRPNSRSVARQTVPMPPRPDDLLEPVPLGDGCVEDGTTGTIDPARRPVPMGKRTARRHGRRCGQCRGSGRVASYSAMRSWWRRVRPMSSRPSMNRCAGGVVEDERRAQADGAGPRPPAGRRRR